MAFSHSSDSLFFLSFLSFSFSLFLRSFFSSSSHPFPKSLSSSSLVQKAETKAIVCFSPLFTFLDDPDEFMMIEFFFFSFLCRRQTAEEREAERQAANRLLMSLQAEASTGSKVGPMFSNADMNQRHENEVKNLASLHSLHQQLQSQANHPWPGSHSAALMASHLNGLLRQNPGGPPHHPNDLIPYPLNGHSITSTVLC